MTLLQPHLDTIWAARIANVHAQPNIALDRPSYSRERWQTPDLDFIDVDFLSSARHHKPLWVLFHGLEGSSQSHYARAFARYAHDHQLNFCVPHFRGCSGEINLAPRAYHSGDWQEIDWVLKQLRSQHAGDVYAVGVSLGGNALMRWAGEVGSEAEKVVKGIVSICSPLDLTASGHHIGRGLNRHLYTPMFLKSMKPNAIKKLAQYPNLFNREAMLSSRDLYEFDNVFTAPLHGFKSTDDYWMRASAKPHMANIQVPALAIHALNDPFIPADSLPNTADVSQHVKLWQPQRGGHVGFGSNVWTGFPGHLQRLPTVVGEFFDSGDVPRG